MLSLRASAQDFRGNPPVEWNQVAITTKNRSIPRPAGQLSIHFLSNRGIATTSLRTGLAMTGNLETERQTPIDHSAGTIDELFGRGNVLFLLYRLHPDS